MKIKIIGLIFLSALLAFIHIPNSAEAQNFGQSIPCFNAGLPLPTPVATGQITAPICINGILQTNSTGSASPIPFPTFPWPIVLPTSFQTAFPTPHPYITNIPGNPFISGSGTSYTTSAFLYGYDSSSGNALPIALDPNAIPALGNALVVACYKNCGTPIPYSAASPMPISLPTSFQTAFPVPPTPIPLHTPTSGIILNSSSATSCTNIQAVASNGIEIINSGPTTTIFPQFYNDASNACSAGTLLYGDGSTITIGAGQIVKIDFPLIGIAYKLSGSLTTNLSVTGL